MHDLFTGKNLSGKNWTNIGSDQIEVAVLPKKGRARIIGLSSSLHFVTIIQRNSCFRKSPVWPPILISIYKINTTNTILNVASMENETQSVQVNYILTVGHIIINGIACPFTVLLNLLVILVVKRRPSLQSNRDKHPAWLFSGNWSVDWSHSATIIRCLENFVCS